MLILRPHMRPLEWLITVSSVAAVAWSLEPPLPLSWWWLAVAAGIVLGLHARFEGMHVQMVPGYLALLGTLTVRPAASMSPTLGWLSAVLVVGMTVASVIFSWALPMFELPAPSGKYPVGTATLHFTDPTRMETHDGGRPGQREVVAQFWYPAATARWKKAMYRRKKETTRRSAYQAVLRTHSLQDAPAAAGRFPVIVHNSAWWGFRNRSTFMLQELASHGYVVVAISHPYNSSMVELADGTVANPDYSLDLGFSLARYIPIDERFAMADGELAIQTADCRLVLDELEKIDRTPGHLFASRLQLDRVGAFGYSFGGAVAVELAREDARVVAALELDGVLHGQGFIHGLDKPLLLIDSPWMIKPGEHSDNPRLAETSRMWNMIAEAKNRVLERCGGTRIIVDGLVHTDFTDQMFMSPLRRFSQAGTVAPQRAAHILNTYVLAFFEQTLRDRQSSLLTHRAIDFPEVTLQQWQPCVTADRSSQQPEARWLQPSAKD